MNYTKLPIKQRVYVRLMGNLTSLILGVVEVVILIIAIAIVFIYAGGGRI